MREHDWDSVEKGGFVVNEENGRFKLFDNGEMFGFGKIVDMDYFLADYHYFVKSFQGPCEL